MADPESRHRAGFLDGVTIVEVANELGEYCGKLLAGLGADVIKVEPIGGEGTRQIGPFHHDVPHLDRSLHFWHYNFGKRSVVLDLDTPAGVADLKMLLASADVVIDTRPRGWLQDRGITWDGQSAHNPGLVWARISPFGDTGPWADFEASDLIHLALGGMIMNCGYDADLNGEYDTPPVAPQMWHSYHIAGELTAIQIIAALCYRNVTGRGQQLSTSVHEAVSANTEQDTPDWIYARQPHVRRTGSHSAAQTEPSASGAARRAAADPAIMRTKDGRWLLPYTSYIKLQGTVRAASEDAVDRLLSVLKKFGAGDDFIEPRFYDLEYRQDPAFVSDLSSLLARFVGRVSSESGVWLEAQAQGLAWAELRRPEENLRDDHWSERETFIQVEHADIGATYTEIGAKWVAPGIPWRTGPAAPRRGEHTDEVLRERANARPALPVQSARGVATRRRDVGTSKLGRPFGLSGVRVIDLSWALASAGAGRFLAALGADVIKVEHSSRPDGMRRGYGRVPPGGRAARDVATEPIAVPATDDLNRSGGFMEINAGKRSVSLNLKHAEGKRLLRDLLRDADIVLEGFSAGTFAAMGFGYDELREINPDIIYVQQSGTGQHGRYGRLRTFGPSAQALSGISEMSGLPEPYAPAGIGYSFLDWFGAYQAATAMVAALYRRDVTGEGCWIDSAQVEAGIYLTGSAVLDHTVNGRAWRRQGNRSLGRPAAPHGVYRGAGEERWIAIAAFTDEHWGAIVDALGSPSWAGDPRFADLASRLQHQDVLDPLIESATEQWDVFELMATLQSRRVPAGVCQTAQDRCDDDPQLAHLGWLTELDQSDIGTWPVRRIPVDMSETPPYIGGPLDRSGPSYGEDTDDVLSALLGLDEADIDQLRRQGVV